MTRSSGDPLAGEPRPARSSPTASIRRESWRLGFVSKVAGFARADAFGNVDLQRDDAGNVMRVGSAPVAVTRIRRTGPIVADEVAFSIRNTKCTVKATLPAPSYLHYPRGRNCVDPDVYPDLDAVLRRRGARVPRGDAALHAAGGRYLQIDEVAQTLLCDQRLRDAVRARGDDPEKLIDLYIDLINRIVRARPPGMTVGVHMCRGNAMGKWIAEGGYERIAEKSILCAGGGCLLPRIRHRSAPAASSRCASSPKGSAWCSAWSRPRFPRSKSAMS